MPEDPYLDTSGECYMDISIGGVPAGRLVFNMFDEIVPITA